MIFSTLPPNGVCGAVASEVESALSDPVFETVPVNDSPEPPKLTGDEGASAKIELPGFTQPDHFDWENKRVNREFILLEQRFLAKKASRDELDLYQAMKRDRNSIIFAERYMQDYAEVQRLRTLSKKLAEIQQYLRPIRL